MKAVDTNVLLRLVTGDDPAQESTARELLETAGIFVPLSVLMEAEWVLRSFYRWPRKRIADALSALACVEGARIERAESAMWAIERFRAGADFADMLHLLVVEEVDAFATFDGGVARFAGDEAPLRVETLG